MVKPKHVKIFRFYADRKAGARVGFLAVDSAEFKSVKSYKDPKNFRPRGKSRIVMLNGRTDAIDFLTELRQSGAQFIVEVVRL
jgi:hypothetical protein